MGKDLSPERTVATPDAPFIRVVRGDATAEEMAALVATLAAVAATRESGGAPEPRGIVREWNNRSRLVRKPLFPSAGGWRRSALP
ncbi:MAG TPA: acyl-CoA carboxylase subunit epsilon [Trebonia sp.]|nr:acyl-CoA carboxylase subunit epsilon [Trebonia sp.]